MIETSVRHRSEVAARLNHLPQISHTAFWEFCRPYRGTADMLWRCHHFRFRSRSGFRSTPDPIRREDRLEPDDHWIGTVLAQFYANGVNLVVARCTRRIVSSCGRSPPIYGFRAHSAEIATRRAGRLRHTIRSCGTWVTTARPWSGTMLKWSTEVCPSRGSSIACAPSGAPVPAAFSR